MILLMASSALAQNRSARSNESFDTFLQTFEAGISRFINGDPALWKKHISRSEDAKILGGWGAYEKGWAQVEPRYAWAAARFQASGAEVNIEYLSKIVAGALAYTVSLERSKVRLFGHEKPAAMALRVTHIFRQEAGGWKLLHRHADVLTPRTAPSTVLQK